MLSTMSSVLSTDGLPDQSKFSPVVLERVTPNKQTKPNEIVPPNYFVLSHLYFLPSSAVPVLCTFVLYSDFINIFCFLSRSLLKIGGKTDSSIDLGFI